MLIWFVSSFFYSFLNFNLLPEMYEYYVRLSTDIWIFRCFHIYIFIINKHFIYTKLWNILTRGAGWTSSWTESGVVVLSNASHDFQPQWKSLCDAFNLLCFEMVRFIIDPPTHFPRARIIYPRLWLIFHSQVTSRNWRPSIYRWNEPLRESISYPIVCTGFRP